jgi:triacylglycerol lipase
MDIDMIIPKLRAPIVLVHGLLGFDRIDALGTTLVNYFPGIPELMSEGGNRVLVPRMKPTGSVAERATQLKDFLLKFSPNEPVHLFAHSMGGLDSRYMISQLGMADKVLTLTTIATPHRGTCFADWGVARFERIIKPLLDSIGLPYQAFYDLRVENCTLFNQNVHDAANVRYFSVAGQHDGSVLMPEWLLPHGVVKAAEGENDGIVSVQSATWGGDVEVWEGDHLRLVNWFHPMIHYRGLWKDPKPRYGALLRKLADLGY